MNYDELVERLRHCSQNTSDEYLHELAGRSADAIEQLRARIAEAVLAEREACAKVAEGESLSPPGEAFCPFDEACVDIAAAIRRRTDANPPADPVGPATASR